MSLIQIRDLNVIHNDHFLLKDVNFSVEQGDVISIIGPSGMGKSRLLRCIIGLDRPDSGSIIFNGQDICAPEADLPAIRKQIGMVFQTFNLFEHWNVAENIIRPQQDLLGISAEDAYEEAVNQLKKVGMEAKINYYPDELSPGQNQRIAIARALALHPRIILFDEPTSSLDPIRKSEVMAVLRDLAAEVMPMIIVTNDLELAKKISTRVIYMDEHTIYEEGTSRQIFEHPEKEKTRNYIFRVLNWNFRITPDADMYEMMASLEEFCRRQFMSRKVANKCELLVEELTTAYLLPAVNNASDDDDQYGINLILDAEENGSKIVLEADYREVYSGKDIFAGGNEITERILEKIAEKENGDKEGTVKYTIR